MIHTHWVSQQNNKSKKSGMVVTLCKALGGGVHGNQEHAWHRRAGPLFPVSPTPSGFTLSE